MLSMVMGAVIFCVGVIICVFGFISNQICYHLDNQS